MGKPSYPVPDYPPPNDLAGFGQLNIYQRGALVFCDTDPLPYWISWSTDLWELVASGSSPWATIHDNTLTMRLENVVMHYRRQSPLVQVSWGAEWYALWLQGYDIPNHNGLPSCTCPSVEVTEFRDVEKTYVKGHSDTCKVHGHG